VENIKEKLRRCRKIRNSHIKSKQIKGMGTFRINAKITPQMVEEVKSLAGMEEIQKMESKLIQELSNISLIYKP
jgi:hypothetical protein